MRTGMRGTRLLAAISFAAIAPFAHAIPEPDDLAGPPAYAINGCPANEEWTPSVLARAFAVPERVVRRASGRLAVSSLLLCTLPYPQVEILLGRAAERKPGFDQPDRAMGYRIDAMRGDDGRIAPDGPRLAHEQRLRVAAQGRAKQGGLSPGQPFWTSLGPGNVGGRVRAILPLTPSRILIGSVSGGLWITENAGAAWSPVADMMPNVAITCLVADPADASIVYVCTGEGAYPADAIQGDGMYRITNANLATTSWSIARVPGTAPAGAGSPWFWVNRLAVIANPADPANTANRVIVAATRSGLYRSADGGASFVRVASETDAGFPYGHRYMDVRAHPLDPLNLVAGEMFTFGAGGGVGVSADGGLTWTRRPIAGSERVEVTPVTGVAGRWLALAGNNGGQLFRSDDGGASWVRQDLSGLDNTTPTTGGVMGTQAWYDQAIWASPDGTRVIAGGVSIRISLDAGASFAKINASTHSDHHAIVPATDNATTGTVYFGNDGGVYRATGVNTLSGAPAASFFTSLNNGLAITQFYGAAGLGGFLTGGTQDNGTKSFNGTSWFGTFGGDGGRSAIDPTNASYVYGSAQNGALFRSIDGGVSASYICAGITEAGGCPGATSYGTLFIAPFTLDQANPDRMLLGGTMLWRSANVRAITPAWAAIKGTQLSQLGAYNATISAIAIQPGASDVIWVGYTDGQVWRTLNGTAATPAWERIVFNGVANPARQVMRIVFDPGNANRAWVALGGYNTGNVLVTGNALAAGSAVNWTDVHGNLPAAPVRTLVRHPQITDTIYAGTEVGVFASDTAGTTWSTQNEGPGTVSVEDLFFTDPGTLIAATHGRGLFKASFTMPAAPGSVQFTQPTLGVAEGGTATFTVTRIGGSAGAASATYLASGGSATPGADYAVTAGTLAWGDGDTSARQVSIAIANDNLAEGTETFTLAIVSTSGVSAGYPSSVAVSIFDPDAFPPGGAMPAGWVRPTTLATSAAVNDGNIVQGWMVDANPANAYEGMYSLRSGDMTGQTNRKAAVEAVVTTGAGNVSFAVRVPTSDCLRFYVDRVQAGAWCSYLIALRNGIFQAVYDVVSIPVTAGTHTFRWQYERGAGQELPPNAAWIDALTFPPSGLEPAFTSSATASFAIGSARSFAVTASGTPAPAFSMSGTLPAGLAFTPGTGTLAGTPAPGTVGSTLVALAASNGQFPNATQYLTIVVTPGTQSIAFGALANRPLGTAPFGVSATATSGLAVAFASTTPLVCTVSGSTVSLVAAGTCSIQATQAGSPDYGAASPVTQGFVVTASAATVAFDFGGDGKSDVLWQHTDGRVAIWQMNGAVSASGSTILGAGSGWFIAQVADFNGDGKMDLLWQHPDGRAAIWLMNGLVPSATQQILNAGGGWSAVHAVDLDGDGKADIVWQNANGSTAVWLMNGTAMTAGSTILGAGTGWSVARTGDFDGDGKSDLLWQHTDGRAAIWLMNGNAVKSTAQILNAGGGWSASHTADLDGDGKADILWKNTNGTIAAWLMNGTTMSSGTTLMSAGSGWSVTRVGDFDGNGKADLFWQHTDGRAAIWLMNGLAATATQQLLGAGGGWSAARLADLNGDGKADIVWVNTNGTVAVWLMNGTATLSGGTLMGTGSGWSVSTVGQ